MIDPTAQRLAQAHERVARANLPGADGQIDQRERKNAAAAVLYATKVHARATGAPEPPLRKRGRPKKDGPKSKRPTRPRGKPKPRTPEQSALRQELIDAAKVKIQDQYRAEHPGAPVPEPTNADIARAAAADGFEIPYSAIASWRWKPKAMDNLARWLGR